MEPTAQTITGELVAFENRLALAPVATLPAVHPATDAYRPDRQPALVYLASLAPGSRRTMRQALNAMAGLFTGGQADLEIFPWHRLEYAHTTAVRSVLAQHYAPATANKMLSALRGVLKEAWRLGYMDAEAYQRATDLKAVRGDTEVLAGRELTQGELRALLDTCAVDPSAAGVRDAAILAIVYGAGCRRAEAARLEVAHLDAAAGALTVHGKGNKIRIAYARGGAAEVLRAWLARRGTTPGRLLVPVSQRGLIDAARRMSEKAIYKRLQKRATQAGVRPFSPHDCRRTFAGDLLDAGADLSTVQRLMGHANVSTTAKYDRRGERAKRSAADLLHFPHVEFAQRNS